MRYTLTWTIKSAQSNSCLNSKPQIKQMTSKSTKKPTYEVGTFEYRIQAIRNLAGQLHKQKKDCHQVFMWYAGSLGHFGLRVSNTVRVIAPTLDACVDEMELLLLIEASKQADNKEFASIQDAFEFFSAQETEHTRIMKEVEKKKVELEELFSKLESLGVNLKMKTNE